MPRPGKAMAAVVMLLLVCAQPSGARASAERGPMGLCAPINGQVASSATVGAPRSFAPAGRETHGGSEVTACRAAAASPQFTPSANVSWSCAIRPQGSTSSLFWSLPIDGPVALLRTARRAIAPAPHPVQKKLEGGVAVGDEENSVAQRIDELLDAALDRNPRTKVLDKAVAHYRTTTQRVIAETKDAADYLVPYRGFGPSIEAGNVILDENVKVKSRASAEYARQKHIDETHVKVVTNVMQIAMGLGMADTSRGSEITASGMKALTDLVGGEEAQKTLEMLSTWSKELSIPESVYQQEIWDVSQRQDKYKYVMEQSLDSDPVIHLIVKRLHKYNQRSKFARVSSQVVQTTLGVASLTPSFIGPAAKLALLSFIMATGGPESCKLMKELYLDKRFESRWKVLNEEAHLALENYQLAVLTRNPVLLACSESLVGQMTGPEHVRSVLGTTVLAHAPQEAQATPAGASNDGRAEQATTSGAAPDTSPRAVAQSSPPVN